MKTGTVKWFNAQKGYGFIQPDDGGARIFVHIRDVEQAGMRVLREGQRINFESVPDKREGWERASSLTALDPESSPTRSPRHPSPSTESRAGDVSTTDAARPKSSSSPFAAIAETISSALSALSPPPRRNA
jgi:CspA family cold shock protein